MTARSIRKRATMVRMTKSRESIGTQRRFSILERDSFTCLFCGARPGNDRLHVDHFVPFSRGGSDHDNNLGAACDRCNIGKGDRVIVPRSICTDEHDRQGWVIWKRWGQWILSWNPGPRGFSDSFLVDATVTIALTYEPEEYWIALDRVHEEDWHGHLEWKPWMKEDDEIAALREHHAAISEKRGRLWRSLSEFLAEPKHPLERQPARGPRWFNFCDAIDFARTLIRPPEGRPKR